MLIHKEIGCMGGNAAEGHHVGALPETPETLVLKKRATNLKEP